MQKFSSFSPSFLFLFPRARRFRLRGLRPLLVCEKGTRAFFRGKRRAKGGWRWRDTVLCFFGVFDPSCLREKYTYSFFRGKWNQKTNGVRDTDICFFAVFPSLFLFQGLRPVLASRMPSARILRGGRVFFSKRKRQSKRKMAGIVCPPLFPLLPAFLFLFLSPSFSAAS